MFPLTKHSSSSQTFLGQSCKLQYFPTSLLLSWSLLELSLPYRASVDLFHRRLISDRQHYRHWTSLRHRYRHLLLLLFIFIFIPTSSRNLYARTVSSYLRKCIEHSRSVRPSRTNHDEPTSTEMAVPRMWRGPSHVRDHSDLYWCAQRQSVRTRDVPGLQEGQ